MNALSVVKAYFAGVQDADAYAVAALFAPDAVLHNTAGTLTGADAIQRMYENGLAPGVMKPTPTQYVVNGDHVAVEISLLTDGREVLLGDFFTIRDGKIQRLAIYSLSPTGGALLEKVGIDPGAAPA